MMALFLYLLASLLVYDFIRADIDDIDECGNIHFDGYTDKEATLTALFWPVLALIILFEIVSNKEKDKK